MFIAHIPGAYLSLKAIVRRPVSKVTMAAVLAGSVAPDLDMLWFHLVDSGQFHHHGYLTHRPAFWITLMALGGLFYKLQGNAILLAFAFGALTHMVLDSIAGKIAWGWPFWDHAYPLVVVPATQSHWILSFLVHWVFQLEILIILLGMLVFWRAGRK